MHTVISWVLRSARFDAVLFEHIQAMLAASLVKREQPQAVRILDTVNVEHHLRAAELAATVPDQHVVKTLRKAFAATKYYETHLSKFVEAFLGCSTIDVDWFRNANPGVRSLLVPNGVDVDARPYDGNPEKASCKNLIFCGVLSTPANRDGIMWFHEEIWPNLRARDPEITMTVVGKGANPADFSRIRADPAVQFLGEVDNVIPYYRSAGIAICPLRLGSGTRLKILEAMSLGNPVVSTSLGAEGIEVANGRNILIADDPQRFTDCLLALMGDARKFHAIREAGRDLVVNVYDWRVIGTLLSEQLSTLLAGRHHLPGEDLICHR